MEVTIAAIKVTEPSQVGAARREAARLAAPLDFSDAELGRIALVTTELATNLVRHAAGGGEMVIGRFADPARAGLQILALDRGPGMADIRSCLTDGYSTGGTAGTGLGAVTRSADLWDIHSLPGIGTGILARINARAESGRGGEPAAIWGGVAVPAPGETLCGDAWSFIAEPALRLVVADGLGHGELAARAAAAVLEAARSAGRAPLPGLLRRMHEAAAPTRGAAAAVAEIDLAAATVRFAGIGNIGGTIIGTGRLRRTVSHNGTLGHAFHRTQVFDYPFGPGDLLVMASDGLVSSWTLDRHRGLAARHPALIAGILYRDFRRGRDDSTVVVVRHEGTAGAAP
jgi:anti-sigma regulatory factor (Ser/Thr protein kinase)